jgi:hypothetical protein
VIAEQPGEFARLVADFVSKEFQLSLETCHILPGLGQLAEVVAFNAIPKMDSNRVTQARRDCGARK